MKKYIFPLFTAALLLLAAGCSKDDDDSPKRVDSGIVGEWRQVEWNDQEPEEFDVYVEFLSDGTCNVFQKVEDSYFVRYSGTFTIDGTRLRGVYAGGEPWRADYDFSLSSDGNTLTMTSTAATAVVSTYARTPIPADVRSASEVSVAAEGKSVRSALPVGFEPVF